MPRGNPAIWKKHGASYAELAGTTTSIERANELAPRRLPPVTPATVAELRSRPPAGAPAKVPLKGSGAFMMQTGWTIGVPLTGGGWAASATSRSDGAAGAPSTSTSASFSASARAAPSSAPNSTSGSAPSSGAAAAAGMPPRTYSTEARANFGPPPPDFRRTRSAGPFASQMPVPNHPNDWCTSKQLDFKPDRYAGATPPQPVPHRDSGRLLPTDVPAAGAAHFTTQQRTHFPGRSQREAQAIPTSGCRATQASGYNIITGAVPYANNAFEHWDARDYRRHR